MIGSVSSKRYQCGLTIIEILVAMVISLILLGGVLQIFMASRVSYDMQAGLSRMQENARFALDTMARSIGMAGNGVNVDAFPAVPQDNVTENIDYGFTIAAGTASDTIRVRYTSNSDCLNQDPDGDGIADDTYDLRREPATGTSTLYCNNQPLVEGVVNLQILYGEDTEANPNKDGVANRYVSSDMVTDWEAIVSVRIAILVSTVDEVDDGISDNNTYRLLNSPMLGAFTNAGASRYVDANNDGNRDVGEPRITSMLHRVFTRTVLLRNYLP